MRQFVYSNSCMFVVTRLLGEILEINFNDKPLPKGSISERLQRSTSSSLVNPKGNGAYKLFYHDKRKRTAPEPDGAKRIKAFQEF